MDAQHINVKIYADSASAPDPAKIVLVFHKWIQENLCEELLIDVADYKHVPSGPGIMLIGHQANYSIDYGPENMPGMLYNRKTVEKGDNAEKIAFALKQ